MIGLMTVRSGDRDLANNFPIPQPDMDPMVYTTELEGAGGEMRRIMKPGLDHPSHHHKEGP